MPQDASLCVHQYKVVCTTLVYNNNVVVCFDQAASASEVARRMLVHCR